MKELLDFEQSAMEDVEAANKALEAARMNAVLRARPRESEKRASQSEHKAKTKVDEKHFSKDNSSKKSRLLSGASELNLDLFAVRHLIENDTMKNLMGKDASFPSSSRHKRRSHQRANSLTEDQVPSDFDLEVQLFKQRKIKQNGASRATDPTTIVSNPKMLNHAVSAPYPIHEESPGSGDPSANLTNYDASNAHIDSRLGTEQGKPGRQELLVSDYATTEDYGSEVPPLVDQAIDVDSHTLSRHRHQFSEPVLTDVGYPFLPRAHHRRLLTEPAPVTESVMGSRDDYLAMPNRRLSLKKQEAFFNPTDPWALVDAIAHDSGEGTPLGRRGEVPRRRVFLSPGNWQLSSLTDFFKSLVSGSLHFLRWTTKTSTNKAVGLANEAVGLANEAVDLVAADSTFAVVTFTSRQAAVAGELVYCCRVVWLLHESDHGFVVTSKRERFSPMEGVENVSFKLIVSSGARNKAVVNTRGSFSQSWSTVLNQG